MGFMPLVISFTIGVNLMQFLDGLVDNDPRALWLGLIGMTAGLLYLWSQHSAKRLSMRL